MKGEKVMYINCFLCGHTVKLKKDKKGNPYFYCDNCRLRVFVGGKEGARLLVEKAFEK